MTDKQIIRRLNVEYAVFLILSIGLYVLGECGVLPEGGLVGRSAAVYALQCGTALLTIVLIPLALKSFHVALQRMGAQPDAAQRRHSYVRWSEIRLALFFVIIVVALTAYYATVSNLGFYCAVMALIASLFCIPSPKGIRAELEMIDALAEEQEEEPEADEQNADGQETEETIADGQEAEETTADGTESEAVSQTAENAQE